MRVIRYEDGNGQVRYGAAHGTGAARTPPVFLQPGDEVTVEVNAIGALTNPVVEEQ